MVSEQKNRKTTVVISLSIRRDQIDHITGVTGENRDRSRWIRLAIDQKIARDKKFKNKDEGVA